MMRTLLLLFLLAAPFFSPAQTAQKVKTDTALAGCYLLPEPNTVSFKVSITNKGQWLTEKSVTGNTLPAELSATISRLAKGAVVIYSDITVRDSAGAIQKRPPVRYVIGDRNTRAALPETLTPAEAGALDLGANVTGFSVTFADGSSFYTYRVSGHTPTKREQDALLKLKPGTKLFFEEIVAKDEKGNEVKLPARMYLIE